MSGVWGGGGGGGVTHPLPIYYTRAWKLLLVKLRSLIMVSLFLPGFFFPLHLLFLVLDFEKVSGSGEWRVFSIFLFLIEMETGGGGRGESGVGRSRYASLPRGSKIQFLDHLKAWSRKYLI